MNLAVRKPMSLAEFLEWEERQELRYEFDGVEPVAMTGGTAGHATIQRNLAMALGSRLRGKPCRFSEATSRSGSPTNSIRYPDGMVVCSTRRSNRQDRSGSCRHLRGAEPQHRRQGPHREGPRGAGDALVKRYVMLEQAYRRDRPRPRPRRMERPRPERRRHPRHAGNRPHDPARRFYEGLAFEDASGRRHDNDRPPPATA